MPAKLVGLIKLTMEQSEGRIILENNVSEKCSACKGIRQDDSLLTVPFDITLNQILKKLTSRGTVASKITQIHAYEDVNGQK
jgi:hypothetical protein